MIDRIMMPILITIIAGAALSVVIIAFYASEPRRCWLISDNISGKTFIAKKLNSSYGNIGYCMKDGTCGVLSNASYKRIHCEDE